MKKIILLSLLVVPAVLLASAGHGGEETRYFLQTGRETDFWPRMVNFTIFASVLYYILANPVKNFFNDRREGISSQLKEIEARLEAAKNAEKEAAALEEESHKKSEEIIEEAGKEAKILAAKIAEASVNDLALMDKLQEEKMTHEEKKSARDVIDEVLSENITNDDILVDEAKVVDIISKKVA